nr:MAG TPA: DNA circulation protein [Caudoviricetes sp.]
MMEAVQMPVCVIAYELYGDYSKADEIVSRNKIKNPLFVPANKTLEVLV